MSTRSSSALAFLVLAVGPLATAQNHPQFPEMKLADIGEPQGVLAVDVNADGSLDVAALRFAEGVLLTLGDGHGSLAAPTLHPAHDIPIDLQFADLDEDGLPDALVCNRESDDVSVLLGDGTGLAAAQHFAADDHPVDLDVGDMDGDGALDLVVACDDPHHLVVLRGDGDGGLATPTFTTTISEPWHLALADFDEDGSLDAVATEAVGGHHLSMFFGDGAGGLAPPIDLGSEFSPGWLTVADVREDGHADVVKVGGTAEGLQVLFGDGLGNLVLAPTAYLPGSNIGARGLLKDMDFDGHLDLLIGRFEPPEVHLLRGDGFGHFELSQIVGTTNARWLDAGDFDGDARLDLLATGNGEAPLSILFADPAGTWRLPILPPLPPNVTWFGGRIASADVDDDGLPDVMLSSSSSPNRGLHLHRGLGDGSWLRTQVWAEPDVTGLPGALALGDMDVDGDIDTVVTSSYTGRVRVLVGDGTGGFELKDLDETPSVSLNAVSIGSLNDDGLPDAAIAVGVPAAKLHLFVGVGGGRISLTSSLALPSDGVDVVLADQNGDDIDDLIAGTYVTADRVLFFKGLGGGAFASSTSLPAGGPLRALGLMDLEPDGLLDVAAGLGFDAGSGEVALFHGKAAGGLLPAEFVPAGDPVADVLGFDGNDDGLVDLAIASSDYDTVSLLEQDGLGGFLPRRSFGAHGVRELLAADANADGAPDLLFVGDTIGALLNGDGPLSVLGEGLPGSLGVPALAALSDVTGGAPFSLRLQPAPAFAPTVLVIGLSLAAAPLKGGVLVPSLDALVMLATDADGSIGIDTTWPAGLPAGLDVWMQAWVEDAGTVHGLAASRGLQVTTP